MLKSTDTSNSSTDDRTNSKSFRKNSQPCKWFLNNRCTRGNNCRFSHAVEDIPEAKDKKVGTGKRLGKWKRDGLQSRSRKRDWKVYNQGLKPSYEVGDPNVAPTCKCDLVCVKRKVEKRKARNFGKSYYSCANWQNKKKNCAFFKWYISANKSYDNNSDNIIQIEVNKKKLLGGNTKNPLKKIKTSNFAENNVDNGSSDSSV